MKRSSTLKSIKSFFLHRRKTDNESICKATRNNLQGLQEIGVGNAI